MKKLFLIVFIVGLPSLLLVSSCTKTGAIGPKGPTGNADVWTDTLGVPGSQWTIGGSYIFYTTSGSTTSYLTKFVDVADTFITRGILDSGTVYVSFTPDLQNPDTWIPLPYQFTSFNGTYATNIVYETSVGKLRLNLYFSQINPTATLPSIYNYVPDTYRFKIVAIAGNL